jgi:hypothetical protein
MFIEWDFFLAGHFWEARKMVVERDMMGTYWWFLSMKAPRRSTASFVTGDRSW